MITLRGQNPMGNVLHVILGPETDLFTDIHGAAVMDITPMLMAMNHDQPVFLSVTRCRSEQHTEQLMGAAGIQERKSSFGGQQCECNQDAALPTAKTDKGGKPEGMVVTLKNGKCQFCGNNLPLLPIEGFKVCALCAQIEIGRKKEQLAEKPPKQKPPTQDKGDA